LNITGLIPAFSYAIVWLSGGPRWEDEAKKSKEYEEETKGRYPMTTSSEVFQRRGDDRKIALPAKYEHNEHVSA